jgi:hypothetical protein
MVIQHLYTKFDVDMMFCFEVSSEAINHDAQSTNKNVTPSGQSAVDCEGE